VKDYQLDPLSHEIIGSLTSSQLTTVQREAQSAFSTSWDYDHDWWCVERHLALGQCTSDEADDMKAGVIYRANDAPKYLKERFSHFPVTPTPINAFQCWLTGEKQVCATNPV
jgi:hypothetical protein